MIEVETVFRETSSCIELTVYFMHTGNFVDYKGCVEKAELIQRVERLYIENENNKKTASQIEESGGYSSY